jgi:hypothetical protein
MTPRGVFLHGYGQNIATGLDGDTLLGGMRNHEVKSQPGGRGEVASTAANAAANRSTGLAGDCLEISLRISTWHKPSTRESMAFSIVTRLLVIFNNDHVILMYWQLYAYAALKCTRFMPFMPDAR